MEFLIPGLILVALMVYASTRIKKTAARAFDEETVETDDFTLLKPEGFLHVINGDPDYAFQAYSKEFGKDDAEDWRQATIDLLIVTDKAFEAVCEAAKNDSTDLIQREDREVSGMRAKSIGVEREKDGREMCVHYLIVDTPGGVFELQTSVLKEHNNHFLCRINEMEDSLMLKN